MAIGRRGGRILVFACVVLAVLALLVACGQPQSSGSSGQPPSTNDQNETSGGDANDYPNKPIRVLNFSGIGGGTDLASRTATPFLAEELGVPMVIENRPGTPGYAEVFNAVPDGYTLGAGDLVHPLAMSLVEDLPFDPTQFTILGRFNSGAMTLVAGDHTGIRSYEDLKNLQTDRPLRFAAFANAQPILITAGLLQDLGLEMMIVNFDSPGPTIPAVVRGDADLGSLGYQSWADQIEAGNVHPIAVWADERLPEMPDVPTISEVGLPELMGMSLHRALLGPPGIPQEIQDTIVEAARRAYAREELHQVMAASSMESDGLWGEDFLKVFETMQEWIRDNEDFVRSLFEDF